MELNLNLANAKSALYNDGARGNNPLIKKQQEKPKKMEIDDDLDALRERITELLPTNNEYAILNLIYHILIQSASMPIDPPLSVQKVG